MSKPYTIIQCLNYFEYRNFKDSFTTAGPIMEYADSTYTIKTHVSLNNYFKSIFFKHAPTANVTQVSFKNGRATYTKLKD